MADNSHAVAPSDEVLAEAAKQVGRAYADLFVHQRTGVTFLLARRRAILADSMGLGKSRTAIVARSIRLSSLYMSGCFPF